MSDGCYHVPPSPGQKMCSHEHYIRELELLVQLQSMVLLQMGYRYGKPKEFKFMDDRTS